MDSKATSEGTRIHIHDTERDTIQYNWCKCSNCDNEFLMASHTLYHSKYCPLCGAKIITKEYDEKKDSNVFDAIEDSFRQSAWDSDKNGKFTW